MTMITTIILFSLTTIIILLYMAYPLWLTFAGPEKSRGEKEMEEITGVSVILLSCNGKNYLNEKINFLLRELSCFESHELIIIDDNSRDGSVDLLRTFVQVDHIKVIYNAKQEGIPFSMNLGIVNAKYEYVIFCDQRQKLSDNILKRIVEPLKYHNVGAVSGCISHLDLEQKCSFIRSHENFLKMKESKTGNLIGVYGPFYAIKKQYYFPIPDHIILDDLYLSLKILTSKQIELRKDCQIIDDDFSMLYDYKRIKRYLTGFIQILKDEKIISGLSNNQKIMLIWHKYLRLLIPLLIFLCYLVTGIMAINRIEYLIIFCIFSSIGLLSVLTIRIRCWITPLHLLRMNILYFFGLIDLLMDKAFPHRQEATGNNYRKFGSGNPGDLTNCEAEKKHDK